MILERLGQRLSLLHWEAQDLPRRQQTMRSAIAWSYDMLSTDEQAVFRRLGIFAGSFSLLAGEAVAEPLGIDTIEGLASLVDKSLVRLHGRDLDNVRYILLEGCQAYARERLIEAGEQDDVAQLHAMHYLSLAERAEPELMGRDQRRWFERLEQAHENMRAALRWFLGRDGERGLRMATALGYFWEARGYPAEGRRHLEDALAQVASPDPRLRAKALSRLGNLLTWLADEVDNPTAVLTEAAELARSVGDVPTLARALTALGVLGLFTREWEQSRGYLDEARAYWRDLRDDWETAFTLLYLGANEFGQGHDEEAVRFLEESLSLYRVIGDGPARGIVLIWLVYTIRESGDLPVAVGRLEELRELSDQSDDRRLLYLCGAGTTWLLREHADPEQLVRVLGAIWQLREMMGIDRSRIFYTNVVLETTTQTLQTRLGPEAYDAAFAEGRRLSFQEMAALLRELLEAAEQGSTPRQTVQSGPLSPREHEVLHLIAEGLSNKQIAVQLIIAESTAKYYVTGIFNKLGVDTRAQAVAVAAQRGLL
jgi:non-specific serine/threonine protein kinase